MSATPDESLRQVEQMIPRLRGLAIRRLPEALRAKLDPMDLVQSVIKSWFRGSGHPHPPLNDGELWLLLADRLRKKRVDKIRYYSRVKRSVAREVPLAGPADAPGDVCELAAPQEQAALAESLGAYLDALLLQLPEEQRTIVVLRHLKGWTVVRIADELQLSRDSVNRRYARAMLALREAAAELE